LFRDPESDCRRVEDVVQLEQIINLVEPFGPVGRAAALLAEPQFQMAQQICHFLAWSRLELASTWLHRDCRARQVRAEKLTADFAFYCPKAEPERQLVEECARPAVRF
jgi:hypothetical protein